MSEQPIIVVPSSVPGRGVCVECGNGLWPGQPPCEHKRLRVAAIERRFGGNERSEDETR